MSALRLQTLLIIFTGFPVSCIMKSEAGFSTYIFPGQKMRVGGGQVLQTTVPRA